MPFDEEAIVVTFVYGPPEHERRGAIVLDDGCYTLWHSGPAWFGPATHWFAEAVDALMMVTTTPRS